MTALSLVIAWRWVTLNFASLENMMYLKNLNKVLHLQTEGIISQAHLLTESEKHIKICKHDMRHHLAILGDLIHKNQLEEALCYIQEQDAHMETHPPIVYCQNVIVNAAILIYMTRAAENNIAVPRQSMLSIAQKYQASASCSCKNDWFVLTFLFTEMPLL